MRMRTVVSVVACAAATVVAGGVVATSAWSADAPPGTPSAAALALARQAIPANDGWASTGTGTTGGSAAEAANVAVARNRAELVAALGGNNATNATNATPKIIFVSGTIDLSVDDANSPLTCADYADPEYSLDAFLAAYDPAVWGRATRPTGPLEDARVRSTRNQGARININVGSNTTIIGINNGRLLHGNLLLNRVSNVIIRNVTFEDAADCFPAWDPTDGSAGNWNSLYDLVTLTGATNVWFDHNTLSDGNNTDESQPRYFDRPYQVHDGALDVIRASDLVTASYNNFFEHDKTSLVGSSNTVGADVGKLRVTYHHNRFANVGQRVPRVRFGQVDIYNNYFYATDEDSFSYAWGVGVYASIYAENNFIARSADIPIEDFVFDWRGTAPGAITEIGTLTRVGTGPVTPVNVVAAYNALNEIDLPATDWVPTARTTVDPAAAVPGIVTRQAGARKLLP